MRKNKIILIIIALVVLGAFFYFRYQIYYSRGSFLETKNFVIEKGEGNAGIASRLRIEGLISGKIYFYCYLKSRKLTDKILPGEYEISGNLTIPEIALIITQEENRSVKITFPEGWTSKQMAQRLSANGLPGEEFLKIVNNPGELTGKYDFLTDNNVKNLEGYLFPDTYFFAKDTTAENIVVKILGIFNTKITPQMKENALAKGKNLNEIIIMASIIEGEVRSDEDRKIASGIFWKRLENNQPLESCATLAYVLGVRKKQYSEADTWAKSPFNTYINKGLPPGPISNPGISSIMAALNPEKTDYYYFLSDPGTGETMFSKTYSEHVNNKAKYGL